MAGFLFKKQKQEPVKGGPIVIGNPTTLQSAPTPPLYAKFATSTTQGSLDGYGRRMVSGPISPTSPGRRESVTSGISGRHGYSTTSLTSDRRRAPDAYSLRRNGAEPQLPKRLSREILDKPLPPPAPPKDDEDFGGRRAVGKKEPPSSYPAQQSADTRGRASLDVQQPKTSKLPPRPGSAQASYTSTTSSYTSSPSRTSTTSSSTRQIAQPNANVNRKIRASTTPLVEKALPTPEDSTTSLPPQSRTQDFPADRPRYRNGTANAYPSVAPPPTAPPSRSPYGNGQGQFSESRVGIPPEVSLFQEYGEITSVPSAPSSMHSRQGPPTEGSSSNARSNSSVPIAAPSPSFPNGHPLSSYQPPPPTSPVNPPSPRRPLPSPPPNNMGNTPSSPTGSAMLSSPYRDLYPSHVLSSMNGQYGNGHNMDQAPQHASLFNQQTFRRSLSPPLPLPPGAGVPAPFPGFAPSNVDQAMPGPSQAPFRNEGDKRGTPDRAQTLVPPQSASPHASLRKSPSVQNAPVTRRGPKIFAAMEVDQEPQQPVYMSPSQMSSQPLPSTQIPESSFIQPISHRRHQGDEFSTPTSDFEPLPDSYLNEHISATEPRIGTPSDMKTPSPLPPPILATEPPTPTPPPAPAPASIPDVRPRKRTNSRSATTSRQNELPQTPPRPRKLSKARQNSESGSFAPMHHTNGSIATLSGAPEGSHHHLKVPRTITKSRPTTPNTPNTGASAGVEGVFEPVTHVDEETIRNAGIPLDDDPFAKTEGVRMLKTSSPSKRSAKSPREPVSAEGVQKGDHERNDSAGSAQVAAPQDESSAPATLAPGAPEEFRQLRREKKEKMKAQVEAIAAAQPETDADMPPRELVTMLQLLTDVPIFTCLLDFLSFYEWCLLLALSKEIRLGIVRRPGLREAALERFLKTVGYSRWAWEDKEPLSLSLQDLSDYMRGVSTPTHEYARVAGMYIHSLRVHPTHRDPSLIETVQRLTTSTRAYNRVLLRLRAQAEKEASLHRSSSQQQIHQSRSGQLSTSSNRGGSVSRASSRAPSPAASHNSAYGNGNGQNGHLPGTMQTTNSQTSLTFKSPLFRLRRAPLLRVFVPSPEGDWLSDKSVLECEAECRRAGILPLMRIGDVVWDVAVGDEGNVGRLVYDGSYLIDLDYTFSSTGELPKYLPTLAFPPSYFHRVIRTGPSSANPIVHIDISMWGEEIAMNLQLLQDRVKTETPQGAYHNVMRWVHRSSFQIRPSRGPPRPMNGAQAPGIPLLGHDNLFVDSGWYGTIVVETEGTNEALADLQDRCGPGAFPSRPRAIQPTQMQIENRKVYRVLREKSRPGEIWIRAVGMKERLL